MDLLQVDDLCKVYQGPFGGVAALRDVFSVSHGSFVAVRGLSFSPRNLPDGTANRSATR
jgi:hypothetical protein